MTDMTDIEGFNTIDYSSGNLMEMVEILYINGTVVTDLIDVDPTYITDPEGKFYFVSNKIGLNGQRIMKRVYLEP